MHDSRLAEALVTAGDRSGGASAAFGPPAVKRIAPRFPWSSLPPQFWVAPLLAPGGSGDRLTPPWPDIVIATGRQTVAPALAIRKASGGRTFCVQIQNPVFGRDRFDLLAVPAHDWITGANVIECRGALHRVTPAKLAAEADRFRATLTRLPRPLVAVLIGGSNRQYRMTGADNEAILHAALADCPAYLWNGTGDNPYFGLLGLADAIAVTADSVSMVSEACATGKPVYVIGLDGGSAKFERFHAGLRDAGITRPFDGTLETWSYDPPNDTAAVAAEIIRRLDAR